MDSLLDAPSGSIAYRDVRAAVAAEIRSVMLDPVVETFRNLRRMTANKIARFDPLCPSLPGGPLVDPDDFDDSSVDSTTSRRKLRFCTAPKYFYTIGNYETSTFYREFLLDELVCTPSGRMVLVRDMTKHTSHNPKSSFWSWFCMPLFKVSKIVSRFITEGWIGLTHHCRTNKRLQMKAELLVLGSLAMLGGTIQLFRQLKLLTHICTSDHSNFFLCFVERIASISQEYVFMPCTPEELEHIMQRYEEEGLPSVSGLVDVVHVKKSNCPAGDYNRSKGKDPYPSLAFECITDFDCHILGVCGPQFGSNNDKHIVKIDENIRRLNKGWLSQVEWKYYAEDESISSSTGVYVICDNGYICWPTTICPFMSAQMNSRLEDYFLSMLESLWKDVECVFGILKGRWASLDKGFKYRDVKTCGQIFLTCAVLHNMMLSEMVREGKPPCLQRGVHLASNGIWLEGPSESLPVLGTDNATKLKEAFDQRRMQLCHHLRIWRDKNKT
jgi:hypothetical protein